jgi:hypothetical protein
MKNNIFLLYFLLLPKFFFSQTNEKFQYLDTNQNTVNVDFVKDTLKLNSKKRVFIYGYVFDRALDLENKSETEHWIVPYSFIKIESHFTFFDLKSSSGYSLNLLHQSNNDPLKYKRSTLFILTKDSLIINELNTLKSELSITLKPKLSFGHNQKFKVFQLENIRDFEDFKWKTNQLLYNLDRIEAPEKIKEEKSNKYLFQLGMEKAIFASKNKNITDFSTYQLDLNLLKKIYPNDKFNVFLGIGLGLGNYSFRSIENSLTGAKSESESLDSIYCSINGLEERYNAQNIKVNLSFIISRDFNDKNSLQFGLTPYFSFVNKFNSTITSGSITTYGTNNQINEFIYDIPKLGLSTWSTELINQTVSYKTLNYGFNARFSYSHSFGEFSLNPFIGLQGNVYKNKDRKNSSFSTIEGRYYGSFSTRRSVTILSPTIGLSIVF